MPLLAVLAEILKSGKITVSTNETQSLEIKATNKKIDINAVDKRFLKEALAATGSKEGSKGIRASIKGTVGQIKTARSNLDLLKGAAEELSDAGITVTLSYKGNVVITMGSAANPKLSSAATGTKAIEINSPRKLFELGL